MNKNQKQEPLQEMIQVLKGDYNFPVKLWVWGKVVKEWAGIIVGSAIFFLVALFIVLSIKGERQNTKSEMNAKQAVVSTLPIKDIVAFLATTQRSINKRQEIFESLIKTMESYGNEKLDKKSLEIKISTLSSIFRTCNTLRGRFINEFTRAENPDEFFNENNKVLNFQRDNEEWGKLCDLCQNEVKKANNELVQLLNEEGRQ